MKLRASDHYTFGDGDVDSLVEHLWHRYRTNSRPLDSPVDLFQIASLQQVAAVDLRPMFSEGGLAVTPEGFKIYIRDLDKSKPETFETSSSNRPTLTPRQRFTFAHELGHTLFFESDLPLRPRRFAPKGKKLEALCHRAARGLLLPTSLIEQEFNSWTRVGSDQINSIAFKYCVSVEVVIARCDDFPKLKTTPDAILYVRKGTAHSEETIARVFWPSWFRDQGLKQPEIGSLAAEALNAIQARVGQVRTSLETRSETTYFVEIESQTLAG